MIPQTDPRAGYLAHRREIDQAVQRVMDSGRYVLGPEVAAFESEFAAHAGAAHAVGVASGTDALVLALRCGGIGRGDAVVTVSHTAVATVAAIRLAGAQPVLVDVDPDTYTLDPARLEDTVRSPPVGAARIRAVIPVHLYGQPADMRAISALAHRYGLYVVEDCAQAHGAVLDGQNAGTFGHVGAFSFYPTKNLGALGDAGALITTDPVLAERARALREYGWHERYVSAEEGMNTRLDDLQAAVLRVKLQYLDEENASRRRIAAAYDVALHGTTVTAPHARAGAEHVFHQYVIRSSRRAALRAHLETHGVGTAVHYPVPVHRQPAYHPAVVVGPGGLATTDRLAGEILSLPMYPQLTDQQAATVGVLVRDWTLRSA